MHDERRSPKAHGSASIAALAPRAARMNKQTFRGIKNASSAGWKALSAIENIVNGLPDPYAYADSAEHREGSTPSSKSVRPRSESGAMPHPTITTTDLRQTPDRYNQPTAMSQQNLFSALRAAFPDDLSSDAVETTAPDGTELVYSWDDLERASASIANLLASLKLPEGSRVAVQVENRLKRCCCTWPR